jgi:hypothetical protein
MRTFRKHRKVLLAVLTLLAMLSFVFLPTISEIMQTGRRGRNPVVVKTTKYGSLTERQVDGLLRQRQRLYAFLRQLHDVVRTKGGRGDAIREALNSFGASPANEEAAVENWLHAMRAEELGFKVSEKAVNEYLASLTEGKAGNDDVRQILQRMRMSQGQLFEGLRTELLALRFAQTFWISLAAATPAQRWEYYQQLNRKAKIEAIPVPAAKFVDKVAPPSEEDLRAFFEKYKDRLPDPNSPDPGFREPHRIDVQYLKATVETFMEPGAVTEQAIRDYYEENKDRLYKDALPEAPAPAAAKPEPAKPEPTNREPAKAELGKPASSKTEPPRTEPAKPEPAKAELGKPESSKTEPPKTDAPKAKPAKGDPSSSGKSSALPRRSLFRLVGEEKTVVSELPKLDAPAKAEPLASGSKQAKTEPGSSKPEPEASKPGAASKPDVATPKPDVAVPKAEAPASKPEAAKPAPVKYKPLADVQEEIRKTLAREAAEAKIRDVLRRLQDRLAQFETQWTIYDSLEPEKKASTSPPVRPDFIALAKEHRLVAAQTGLMSALQMRETDIGKSMTEDGTSFIEAAFHKSALIFRPGLSQDTDGHSYLFWKTDDAAERVPEFDEPGVRQRVLDEWNLFHARTLAMQEAERLAAEARKAGKPLAEAFAGRKDLQVLAPPPFTWLTFGNVPAWFRMRPPQLSEVSGLPSLGTDFMRSVFALKAGEIGLATDRSKSTVYVVRLVEYTPSDSVLWDTFVADDYRGYAMVARYDQMEAGLRWREQIRSEAGVQWLREPFRGRGEVED